MLGLTVGAARVHHRLRRSPLSPARAAQPRRAQRGADRARRARRLRDRARRRVADPAAARPPQVPARPAGAVRDARRRPSRARLPGRPLGAFCAGLLRPWCTSRRATLRCAGDAELHAILAHEEHHCARRDPLRLLLARVVADAIGPLPPFAALAERQAAVADLAADAAAVSMRSATRRRSPRRSPASTSAASASRPSGSTGSCARHPAAPCRPRCSSAAAIALAGIAALVAPMLLARLAPRPRALPVLIEPAVLIAVCAPRVLRGASGRNFDCAPRPELLGSVVVGPTTGQFLLKGEGNSP